MGPNFTAKRTYEMLGNQTLWELAEHVNQRLGERRIDFAIVGGVAVCLHGYRRNTVSLVLLVRAENAAEVRAALESEGFSWSHSERELRAPSGIPVRFVMAGEREGMGQSPSFPDPADPDAVTRIDGLPVLTLAALIQSKLACGLGDMRRMHRDFADVVELIAIHRLDGSFARFLHKSVQPEFRELVRQAGAES